jgi:ABC-type dipeptide/oligopeptide/nickel transport system permease component
MHNEQRSPVDGEEKKEMTVTVTSPNGGPVNLRKEANKGAALVDRVLLQLVYTVQTCMQLEKNPQGFGSSMIYMSVKSKDILLAGVWTTVRIALLGTAIAFVLSIFMIGALSGMHTTAWIPIRFAASATPCA